MWHRVSGGSASGCEFVLTLAVLLPSTMVRHRICRFYLYFQASNNHLVRCDKSGVGAGQVLSLNLQHGILMTVSNHSLPCSIFPLSQTISHLSISLSLLSPSVRSSCVAKRRIKNSSVGYFSQRTLSVESLRITVILSFLDQTKTVVS